MAAVSPEKIAKSNSLNFPINKNGSLNGRVVTPVEADVFNDNLNVFFGIIFIIYSISSIIIAMHQDLGHIHSSC